MSNEEQLDEMLQRIRWPYYYIDHHAGKNSSQLKMLENSVYEKAKEDLLSWHQQELERAAPTVKAKITKVGMFDDEGVVIGWGFDTENRVADPSPHTVGGYTLQELHDIKELLERAVAEARIEELVNMDDESVWGDYDTSDDDYDSGDIIPAYVVRKRIVELTNKKEGK